VSGTAAERYSNASGFSGQTTSWAVGLALDWAIVDIGRRAAEARTAAAGLLGAEALLEQVRAQVSDEVHGAWLEVETLRGKVEAARRGATVALATTAEVRARFQAGTAAQVELVLADRDALEAEVARIRAEGELALARLVLDRAAGRPLGP
jgi:outer membrane protein TolC